ncbi:MAG: alkaline phosphatase family protein [Gemmatimonadota bacterium]|nr:alkaline phosphatase family protein [Gemmatimonadota bacterium]
MPVSRTDRGTPSVIILLADGARADTLASAIDAGALPAMARMRDEGGMHEVTTVFPSVTGPAYAPFLMGRFPGDVGLPGLRWFDRARTGATAPDHCRSYVGVEMAYVDRDIDPASPTAFELAPSSLGAMNMISRGLPRASRLGAGWRFALRAAGVHFRGDVRGWLAIDRDMASSVARHVREQRPAFTFAALTGVDKSSHATGHDGAAVIDALRVVDELAAEIRHDAERAGRWDDTHLWIASDHGHSPVRHHDDLAGAVRAGGYGVIAHPWVYGHRRDVAVMVSGNAMAHLYVELARRERGWWPALRNRWESLAALLLERESVDVLMLPIRADLCEVRTRDRGTAHIAREGSGPAARYSYLPVDGDPLGFGELRDLTADESHDATIDSDYPDATVQIASLAGSSRAGDLIISAARDWDLRAKWEPIPHRSSHGALHRDHMIVPLLLNHRPSETPRRTTDVFASAMHLLGVPLPAAADGASFARAESHNAEMWNSISER